MIFATPSIRFPILALMLTCFSGLLLRADILLYEETFDNDTASGLPLDTVDWNHNYGTSATATDTSGTSISVSSSDFIFHGNYQRFQPQVWWTDVQTFGDVADLTSFTFDTRNSNTSENLRATFRVGGTWYISEDIFNQVDNTQWETQEFLFENASVSVLNFTPGSTLPGEGNTGSFSFSTANMPTTGTVDAIGIYDVKFEGTLRVDNVTVSAVPEPGTLGLMLIGLGGLMGMRFHARRS